jgi:hypothetical protein
MVRIVQDIDRWSAECGTTVEHDGADGTRVRGVHRHVEADAAYRSSGVGEAPAVAELGPHRHCDQPADAPATTLRAQRRLRGLSDGVCNWA